MNNYEMNRRQALITAGLGALTMGLPGAVIGNDKVDSDGNATSSRES